MIASPNSEHFSSLAPSIRRSKSEIYSLGVDCAFHTFNNQVSRFDPTHMAQHHLSGENNRASGLLCPVRHISRRSTVGGFKQGAFVVDVCARRYRYTNLRCQGVRNVVTVQVHTGDNIIFSRTQDLLQECISNHVLMTISLPYSGF